MLENQSVNWKSDTFTDGISDMEHKSMDLDLLADVKGRIDELHLAVVALYESCPNKKVYDCIMGVETAKRSISVI